jgi:hypothetical protein
LAERWHEETSSFHFLIGEMIITLDDVASLTHLSIFGEFFSSPTLSSTNAARVAHEMLGMGMGEAIRQVEVARGPSLRFSYIATLVPRLVGHQ